MSTNRTSHASHLAGFHKAFNIKEKSKQITEENNNNISETHRFSIKQIQIKKKSSPVTTEQTDDLQSWDEDKDGFFGPLELDPPTQTSTASSSRKNEPVLNRTMPLMFKNPLPPPMTKLSLSLPLPSKETVVREQRSQSFPVSGPITKRIVGFTGATVLQQQPAPTNKR